MKSFFTTLLLLLLAEFSYGQYTEVINSRRPGFSDTPYSLGTKVYQVEAGLFYKNVGNYLYYPEGQTETYSSSSFGSDITFRTGQFFERLEFSLDMAVASESRDYTRPEVINKSVFGFSRLTLGAKYLLHPCFR